MVVLISFKYNTFTFFTYHCCTQWPKDLQTFAFFNLLKSKKKKKKKSKIIVQKQDVHEKKLLSDTEQVFKK